MPAVEARGVGIYPWARVGFGVRLRRSGRASDSGALGVSHGRGAVEDVLAQLADSAHAASAKNPSHKKAPTSTLFPRPLGQSTFAHACDRSCLSRRAVDVRIIPLHTTAVFSRRLLHAPPGRRQSGQRQQRTFGTREREARVRLTAYGAGVTEWTFLFDYPAGRVLAMRGRPDDGGHYALLRLDTSGAGEVWRDADDEVVAYDVPLDLRTHRVEGRPDLPVPLGMPSLEHADRRYVFWPQPAARGFDATEGRTYDVHDLVRAYLDLDRWADAPRRRWARRRYEALTRGLGVAGRGPADQPADPASAVEEFFRNIVDQVRAIRSPFEGLLEAPSVVIHAYQQHGEAVGRSVEAARASLIPVLALLLQAGWDIEPGATVRHEQLAEWGWDLDDRRPEPVDEW